MEDYIFFFGTLFKFAVEKTKINAEPSNANDAIGESLKISAV